MRVLFASALAAMFITAAVCAVPAAAQSKRIRVLVESAFEPTSAIGLLISGSGTTERLEAVFEKHEQNRWIVSFPFNKDELEEDTTASAILVSADGELAFGDVQRVGKENLSAALLSLPTCKHPTTLAASVAGQFALVESLIGVRSERRDVWRTVLEQELDPDTITKLSQLEERLGLARATPLGPELAPLQLLDRLTRVKVAITKLKSEKTRREQATKQAQSAQASETAQTPAAQESPEPEA